MPRDSSVAQPLTFEENRNDYIGFDGSNWAGPWQSIARETDYSYVSVGEQEEGEMHEISGPGIAIGCLALVTLLALLVIAFVLFRQRSKNREPDLCGRGDGQSKKTDLETATPSSSVAF